jgi:hypothetical protein
LERGDRGEPRRAEFDARHEVSVVAIREEVAKAKFLELIGPQVRFELEPLLEVVGADLDARLTDLEGGLWYRMLPLLDDKHAQAR